MRMIANAEPVRDTRSDFPLVIANMPASARLQRIALGVTVLLLVLFAIMSPYANVPLPRIDAFIPAIQTVMCITDLITSILLLAQYSIQPQRALLSLASGYISSGVFAFLQTLAFPGAYAPSGILGGGQDTASWLFVLWHTTFPIAVLVYSLWKDQGDSPALSRRSIAFNVAVSVGCTLAVTAVLTLLVTAGAEYLPRLYVGGVLQQALAANLVNVLMLVLHVAAVVPLFFGRRTILDTWLIVTLFAWMPN